MPNFLTPTQKETLDGVLTLADEAGDKLDAAISLINGSSDLESRVKSDLLKCFDRARNSLDTVALVSAGAEYPDEYRDFFKSGLVGKHLKNPLKTCEFLAEYGEKLTESDLFLLNDLMREEEIFLTSEIRAFLKEIWAIDVAKGQKADEQLNAMTERLLFYLNGLEAVSDARGQIEMLRRKAGVIYY